SIPLLQSSVEMNTDNLALGNGEESFDNENIENNLDLMEGVIHIEKINLRDPIVQGTSNQVLDIAIGSMFNERKPGETGNYVLAGHRSFKEGKQFRHLD